jgi:lipopolysaccharide export LptBFGC system permease protein LptF
MKTISVNRQQGSAHIIIVAVLAVALVGALGYIFWSNILQPKSETKTNTSAKADVTASPSVSASPKADDGTIVLSDWKVKFKLPDSLKNTSVKYSQQTKGGVTSYGFTTARIEALGSDCATQPYGKTLVLARSTKAPSGMDGYVLINQAAIDGYYYTYTETLPMCSGSTTEPGPANQVEIDDNAALGELLKSLNISE